jgi:hypothetical protein
MKRDFGLALLMSALAIAASGHVRAIALIGQTAERLRAELAAAGFPDASAGNPDPASGKPDASGARTMRPCASLEAAVEFRKWAHPYFAGARPGASGPCRAGSRSRRTYGRLVRRALDTPNMGPCRGSGVLVATSSGWKIAQYNLALTVPNGLVDEFKKRIEQESKKDKKGPDAPDSDRGLPRPGVAWMGRGRAAPAEARLHPRRRLHGRRRALGRGRRRCGRTDRLRRHGRGREGVGRALDEGRGPRRKDAAARQGLPGTRLGPAS